MINADILSFRGILILWVNECIVLIFLRIICSWYSSLYEEMTSDCEIAAACLLQHTLLSSLALRSIYSILLLAFLCWLCDKRNVLDSIKHQHAPHAECFYYSANGILQTIANVLHMPSMIPNCIPFLSPSFLLWMSDLRFAQATQNACPSLRSGPKIRPAEHINGLPILAAHLCVQQTSHGATM